MLTFAQGSAARLLWAGKRPGALLQFGLLPLEAAFWYGFGLPIPPLLAIVPPGSYCTSLAGSCLGELAH